ncbi:MAG: virulence-associated protein E [Phenylobacterium sp.]|uniref:DUF7146 domain-containing protein n=1 Tax=Phenylobacterium sp. TaxID=1871053 RepID=UPI001216223C|nr:toprim domain-containing protein [Phenylobacterium sp.]TAJ71809.1 MAG: virulence-associated protein E [Phenylobacterium sp.]
MSGVRTLAGIVRALGGDLYAGGRRANVPGPGHQPGDRSVSLLLTGGRVVAHSFAEDDWRDVLADLAARGLIEPDGRLRGGAAGGVDGGEPPVLSVRARLEVARRLWDDARPLGRTLSARHLERRGVAAPPGGLRHHPGVAAAVYADAGARRPALLAAIRDPGGELVGVEVTYLAPDGERARLAIPRKTVGLAPSGAAVRLWPAAQRLLVGEGVFTCLSAAHRFGLPAWALLSARSLGRWRAPAGVEVVLIAADRGRPGEAAAADLARRLRGQGVRAEIRLPPRPWRDWNEVPAGRGGPEGEEGPRGAGAADGRSGPPARRPRP